MLPPKQKSDVKALNDLIAQITPYLQGDANYSNFTSRRIDAQIEEIKDPYYYKVAKYYFLFSIGNVEEGTKFAELAVSERPQDVVSWGNYILCSLNKIGLERALELSVRAAELTKSPRLIRDSFYYARGIGDFKTFDKYLKMYAKLGLLESEISDDDNASLSLAIQQSELANQSGLVDVIARVGRLMSSFLEPLEQLDSAINFYMIDEEEPATYVLEICPPKITPEKCAELSLELIRRRAEAGEKSWEVVGIFATQATKESKGMDHASHC